jgi:PAS domain S-box-containing protein
MKMANFAEIYAENILETIRESLLVMDLELNVVLANASFLRTFDVKPEETIGKRVYDLGNKQWNIPQLRKLLEDILPDNNTFDNFEVEHVFPVIGQKIMLLNARKIEKENMILLAIEDITDLKKLQKEIEILRELEAEKEKKLLSQRYSEMKNLLRIVSHDLRAPLVCIQAFSSELSRDCDSISQIIEGIPMEKGLKERLSIVINEYIPESVNFMQASVSKMESLLGSISKLMQTGNIELNINKLDMNELMKQIILENHFLITECGANVDFDSLPPCLGDPDQINQVFSNLLTNAIKYRDTSRKCVIRISGKVEGQMSVYRIDDNGQGIPESSQTRVFELFYRSDPKGPAEGDGLGLTASKEIIDRHNGRIWLESTFGKGSSFFVSLPSC